jgi:hypothetical protein
MMAMLLQDLARTGNEGRDFYEIARRISADDKLGEHDEVSTTGLGETGIETELVRVAGEVPDSGVDLSECDLHTDSVMGVRGGGKVRSKRRKSKITVNYPTLPQKTRQG